MSSTKSSSLDHRAQSTPRKPLTALPNKLDIIQTTIIVEASTGAEIFLQGSSGCLWRLPAGSPSAERVRLPVPPDARLSTVVELDGWLYILANKSSTGTLLRLRL